MFGTMLGISWGGGESGSGTVSTGVGINGDGTVGNPIRILINSTYDNMLTMTPDGLGVDKSILDNYILRNSDETIGGNWTFTNIVNATATNSNKLENKSLSEIAVKDRSETISGSWTFTNVVTGTVTNSNKLENKSLLEVRDNVVEVIRAGVSPAFDTLSKIELQILTINGNLSFFLKEDSPATITSVWTFTQVINGTSSNSAKLEGYTLGEIVDGILTTIVDNAPDQYSTLKKLGEKIDDLNLYKADEPYLYTHTVTKINNRHGAVILNKDDVNLGNVPNVDTTNPANIVWTSNYRVITDADKAHYDLAYSYILTNRVEQGTGIDQLQNQVKIGWSSEMRVKCTVDNYNVGNIVFDSDINFREKNYSKKVGSTAHGFAAADNGANTWCKLAAITSSVDNTTFSGMYSILSGHVSNALFVNLIFSVNITITDGTLNRQYSAITILTNKDDLVIDYSCLKMVANGRTVEIWVRKKVPYQMFFLYELGFNHNNGVSTFEYYDYRAWQQTEPTGNVMLYGNDSRYEIITLQPDCYFEIYNNGYGVPSAVLNKASKTVTFSGAVRATESLSDREYLFVGIPESITPVGSRRVTSLTSNEMCSIEIDNYRDISYLGINGNTVTEGEIVYLNFTYRL